MEKGNSLFKRATETTLQDLEAEFGEPLLYRATCRFLVGDGLGPVPLGAWGLLVLTPTRIIFRHFAQSHPLFGAKDGEIRWEVSRDQFDTCAPILQSFWTKMISGTPDHVGLTGPGVRLALETADDQKKFPEAWYASSVLP